MRLIQANKVSQELVHEFLENNQQIKIENILQSGYIVEINHKICGCFILEHIEEGLYVLQQLYITKTEAVKIPILFEGILVMAKEQKAKRVFVNSHKLMIDIILEALQFHPQKDCRFLDKYAKSDGKWWSYTVSE